MRPSQVGIAQRLVVALVLTPTLALFTAVHSAAAARATVFRCETPERVFYTDLGCANAKEVVLKSPVGRVDALSPAERARVDEIDRAMTRRQALAGQQARQTRPLTRTKHTQAACQPDRARDLLLRMAAGGHKKSQLRARIRAAKAKPQHNSASCR